MSQIFKSVTTGNLPFTFAQGTFTPVLAFGGSSTGITYSHQSGEYTQIGNLVTFSLNFTLTSKGSSTGNATISIPISTGASAQMSTLTSIYINNSEISIFQYPGATISSSSSVMQLYQLNEGNNNGAITDFNFVGTDQYSISGLYFIA